jgi:hypothetical protein
MYSWHSEQMARSHHHRFYSLIVFATKIMTSDSEDGNGEPINKGACRKGQRRFAFQEIAAIIRTVERLMQQHGMTRRESM